MQKTIKHENKLSLHREQIRTLSDAQLHNVIGGTDPTGTDRPPTTKTTHGFPPPKAMV